MQERLQKIISGAGLASRRAAEQMLRDGRVTVNGQTAQLGQSADPEEDIIRVDGERLPRKKSRTYVMLNKPKGYVTTMHDEEGRPTVAELVQVPGAGGLQAGHGEESAGGDCIHPARGLGEQHAHPGGDSCPGIHTGPHAHTGSGA